MPRSRLQQPRRPHRSRPRSGPSAGAAQKPEEPPKFAETVVVSALEGAKRSCVNAPATMSVITGADDRDRAVAELRRAAAHRFPGVNITQVSARDINVTSRAATGTLATGQLALLDGRSLYQDFFGFVMWDFLPVNFNEIKQVEVIRGPASAVWGANALYGVVNVISKSPREMQGTSATFGFGGFDRPVRPTRGRLVVYVSGTYADAPNDRWSLQVSGGGYSQDALRAADRSDSVRARRGVHGADDRLSAVREPGHDAAEVRWRAWTTTTRTAASCRSRAASPAPTASCTPGSARSTSTAER